MGWSIDAIAWYDLREQMAGKFAGLAYSMQSSLSPVIVMHRCKLSKEKMIEYAKLFPENIRVEFQEVKYEGEKYQLYGKGDLIMYGTSYMRKPIPIVIEKVRKGTNT